jgi:hypothetical protein
VVLAPGEVVVVVGHQARGRDERGLAHHAYDVAEWTRTAKKTNESGTEPTVRKYEYFYNRNRSLVGMNDVRDPGSATDDRLTSVSRDPVERQSAVNETWTSGKDSLFAYDVAGNVLTRETDGKIDGSSFIGTDAKSTTFE